jgi:signal-transduction protein with cAMP-binding, CBS, and nucleotidyltransferase domain
MICPSCHFENIEGSDECSNCGAPLYGLDLPGAPQGKQAPDFIHQPLSNLPIRAAAHVGPMDPVTLAVRQMQRGETNCVLVIEGGVVKGIITGWDLVQKVAGALEDLNAVTCAQVMTPDPQLLHLEDTVALALNMMAAGGFRHVPIVRDDQPIGYVAASDLFRHISPQLV